MNWINANLATILSVWAVVGFVTGAAAPYVPWAWLKTTLTVISHISPANLAAAVKALFAGQTDAVAKTASKLSTMVLFALALGASGCMVAIPQPGQTPAQVDACSKDATLHNVLLYSSGALTTAAGTEAAVASQDPGASQGLGIAGAVTAGVSAVVLGASAIVSQAYAADGCAPALPAGSHK